MIIDLAGLSPAATYHLMTQTVIPRPIAWVLTRNTDGQSHNLAPFSYFNAVSSDPPLLMLSCAPKPCGEVKDTVKNILSGRDFVIHIAAEQQLQALQNSAKPLPYGESELQLSDLSLTAFPNSQLKRLTTAPIAFACRLHRTDTLGNAPQTLIFAEIQSIYIDDKAVSQQGKRLSIDATKIRPLSRLGNNQFMAFAEILHPQVE